MSLTALDNDKPPRYFASRETTAVAFGRTVPDQPDPTDPAAEEIDRMRDAAFKPVETALRGLKSKGAIRKIRDGRGGTTAAFALVFEPVDNFRLGGARGTENVTLETTEIVTLRGTKTVPPGVGKPYPLGTREEQEEEQGEEDNATQATILSSPVDNFLSKTA
jgi:hypothetical protein